MLHKKLAILFVVLLLFGCAALADEVEFTEITLNGETVVFDSEDVSLEDHVLSIKGSGSYRITGAADNLQIKLTVPKKKEAKVILNGVSLSCTFGPAIYVSSGDVVVEAAADTENSIFDSENRSEENSPSDALIFAADDLTLCGTGKLSLNSLLGNTVHCKDRLNIEEIYLVIHSANDGLRGNDGVSICSGEIMIVAQGDGIQTTNDENDKGNIDISGGIVNIFAEKDAIQAVGSVHYEGGSVTTKNGEGTTDGM